MLHPSKENSGLKTGTVQWSELSGLRVTDVDLRRGRLEVLYTVVEVGVRELESTPKDYEARSIPVPQSVLEELAALVAGRSPDQPLFPGARSGSWLRGRVFKRGWFDPAAETVGLGGLTPHELRHTAASLAISAGANVKAVQRMLGQASAAVTLDVYSDLFDSDLDAVSEALDHAIRRASVVKVLSRPETDEARN
jgi:integrase